MDTQDIRDKIFLEAEVSYEPWMQDSEEAEQVVKINLNKLITLIDSQILQARVNELKNVWNKTQPDIVPEGWQPETPEALYIKDRIETLTKQQEGK